MNTGQSSNGCEKAPGIQNPPLRNWPRAALENTSPYAHSHRLLPPWAFGCVGALLVAVVARAEKLPQRPPPDYHLQEAKFRSMQMLDENGSIPANALMKAVQQKQQMGQASLAWPGNAPARAPGGAKSLTAGIDPASWTWLGPGNIGGRVRSILVNPTNSNILWAGSVGGGVWKTLNGGASWFPLDDLMASLAIGCLALDPTNPDILYAGTGEGFSNTDALRGAGIFKSTDGGASWLQLAATTSSSFHAVNRLSICPTNQLVLLAATGAGIWRSADGGASWSQQYSAAAILDVVFHPTDGGQAIASGSTYGVAGRALYSTDGGLSWSDAAGVPSAGRIEVAYANSSPTTVYASANNNSGEVYQSTDGGASFTLRSTPAHLGDQGWYDNCIWVDPTNPNVVVIGGLDIWRSTDGGASFTDIGGYSGSIHSDQHAIVAAAGYNGSSLRTVFIGNDGGVFCALDIYSASSGSGWTTLNNNLGITQFYGTAGNSSSGTIVGGTQDNGTERYSVGGGPQGWTFMFGGDGGYCAADQTDPNYFYGEYVYLQIHRSVNGGLSSSYITSGLGDAGVPGGGGDPDGQGPGGDPDASANFIAPFILDPNNPNTMLAGGSSVWRSVNVKAFTPTWANIKPSSTGSFISAIAVAAGSSDVIWVGYNNGDVYSTANGTAANPTWTQRNLGSPNLPNRTCTRLTVDPSDFNRVYATFSGFSADNVYRTTDGGASWANLAAGLPAVPVRSLVVAPFNNNFLYVGTEIGVFASADGGATWSAGNEGAANASVDDLFWMNNSLVAATHGRGLYKILVASGPIINLASTALAAENCTPGNGAIDPGETVTVNFTLTNQVASATTNLTATLLAANGVGSPSAPQNYGALAAGSAAVTRPFTFTAAGQCGGTVTATLQLADGTNNLGAVSATFPLGLPISAMSQNFDGVTAPALPVNWTVSSDGPLWYTVNGLSDTPPNAVFAPEPDVPSDDSLVSPIFPIATASARLTFRHNFTTEFSYDGGVLEIAIGGGAFQDIIDAGGAFVTNGYTTVIQNTDSPLVGRSAWTGASAGFITTTVNLPLATVGQTIQLRWRFVTDTGNSTPVVGWYVDSVFVSDGSACCQIGTLGIVTQPTNQTAFAGQNVAFSVQATGHALSYQWQFDGTSLADDTRVTGSHSNQLTLSNLLVTDAGSYQMIVTNTYGSATSLVAALRVLSAPLIDGAIRNLDGSVTLSLWTLPNTSSRVLAATNLNPPVLWQPVATNVAPPMGPWQFTDTNTAGYPSRFYRSSTP